MAVLYPIPFYNVMCYKGNSLYFIMSEMIATPTLQSYAKKRSNIKKHQQQYNHWFRTDNSQTLNVHQTISIPKTNNVQQRKNDYAKSKYKSAIACPDTKMINS